MPVPSDETYVCYLSDLAYTSREAQRGSWEQHVQTVSRPDAHKEHRLQS